MGRRSYRLALAAITAVGLALRIAVPLVRFRHVNVAIGDRSSSTWTWIQANLFADGKGFADPDVWRQTGRFVHSAAQPPLYGIVMGTAAFLGAHSVTALRIVSAIVGALAIPVLARVALHLGGARVSLVAATLVAIHPNLWVDSGLLRPETLLVSILGVVVLTGLRMADSPSFGRAAGLGGAIGLAMLCRVEMALLVVLLAVPVALWSCRGDGTFGRRVAWAATSLAVAALMFTPWFLDSRESIGIAYTLSGVAGARLEAGSCTAATAGDGLGATDPACLRPINLPPTATLATIDAGRWRDGRDQIEEDRTRFVAVVVPARIARSWGVFKPQQTVDIGELFEQRGIRIGQLGLALHYLVTAAAAIGLVVRVRAKKPLVPFVALLAVSMFSAAAAGGNLRYRVSADVALVLLAAIGIDAALNAITTRRAAADNRAAPSSVSAATPGDPTGGVWSA